MRVRSPPDGSTEMMLHDSDSQQNSVHSTCRSAMFKLKIAPWSVGAWGYVACWWGRAGYSRIIGGR
jgi:hypothetical protein